MYTLPTTLDECFYPISICRNSLELGDRKSSCEWVLSESAECYTPKFNKLTSGVLDPSSYLMWIFLTWICTLSTTFETIAPI
jgi:hypothetical protein